MGPREIHGALPRPVVDRSGHVTQWSIQAVGDAAQIWWPTTGCDDWLGGLQGFDPVRHIANWSAMNDQWFRSI